jgi:hypothetical protein
MAGNVLLDDNTKINRICHVISNTKYKNVIMATRISKGGVPKHAMKVHGGVEAKHPLFLTSKLRGGGW